MQLRIMNQYHTQLTTLLSKHLVPNSFFLENLAQEYRSIGSIVFIVSQKGHLLQIEYASLEPTNQNVYTQLFGYTAEQTVGASVLSGRSRCFFQLEEPQGSRTGAMFQSPLPHLKLLYWAHTLPQLLGALIAG